MICDDYQEQIFMRCFMPPRTRANQMMPQILDPEMQAYLGIPAQPMQQPSMLPGTSPVLSPQTPQAAQANQGQDQLNYFLNDLNDDDLQEIRNIYQNIPEEQYNNPQAIEQAVNQMEQASGQPQKYSRIKNFLRKAAPFIGAAGGALAGWFMGGPIGAAKGAATGAGAAKTVEQLVPQPGSSGNATRGYDATQGQFMRQDRFTPQQNQTINDLLAEGMADFKQRGNFAPLQQLLSGVISNNLNDTFDFGPIRERAVKQFNEETLPGIFNRFTSMGKGAQSTGAFRGMLARGGADLNEGLAELEQNYNLKRMPINLQKQELLQKLLGQQQNYDVSRRGVGIDAMKAGLISPYEIAYKQGQPSQPGWFQQVMPTVIKGAGEIGKEYIQNKFMGNKPGGSCASGNCK